MGEPLAGRRRLIRGAAAAAVLATAGYGVAHALIADAGVRPAAVVTAAVDRGAVTTEVATTGTVQPAQTRSLSFAVAGTVDKVSVRPGSTVTAGQILATVDDTDAAAAVSSARDTLDRAEEQLVRARSNASTAPATGGCGADAPAAYASSAAKPPAKSAAKSPAKSAATSAATPSPSVPATAAPRISASRGGGACPGATGRPGGGTDPIFGAEQRVIQAGVDLEKAEDALEGATIRAPIAGRILTVSGKVGNRVTAGAAFITLADVSGMQISAAFPEADADHLAVRQKAVVTLADRPGTPFAATVVQVDPTGTSDGTLVRYGVLLAFDEPPAGLLVGQSAGVRVTTGSKADVLRVPSTAVHDVHGDTGTVLRGGAPAPVGVGLRGDRYTEITSGLTEGEVVARSW